MKRVLFIVILTFISVLGFTQNGENDSTFNPTDIGFGFGDGFDGVLYSIAQQSDGKIIVGGGFTSYNGTPINSIARLNTDGTLDTSFDIGTGLNDGVNSLVIQSDGKILVGGYFTSYNGNPCNNIVRLNLDGSFDSSFNIGTGFTTMISGMPTPMVINSLAIQADNKILASGDFDNYNGTTIHRIARLNPDGTLDNSFDPGPVTSGDFTTIGIQSTGKIVVAGSCSSCNGTTSNHILRLNTDGSTDISFDPGTGFNGSVFSFVIQSDDKIMVVGGFTAFDGMSRKYVARLNANGTLDNSFDPGSGFDLYLVYSVVVQSNQQIVIGGQFTSYNGINSNNIIRLNTDGTVDNSFDIGSGFDTRVYALSIQNDGKIICGGSFESYNGNTRKGIARLNSDGTLDLPFYPGTGFNDRVYSISLQNDGKIIVGGWFTSFNGTTQNRIVRLNQDGTRDNSFDVGLGFTGYNRKVYCVSIQGDGKILVGGDLLDTFNGTSINNLVRLNSDGTLDTSFDIGTGFTGPSSTIYSISIQGDGKIIVAGSFTQFNGISRNGITRLNQNGSIDNTFDPGTGFFNGSVRSIAIQNDGKILAGGFFSFFNGASRNMIVRLNSDGSIDNSFDPGAGFDQRVNVLTLQDDGKILAGGFFTTLDGTSQNRIVRLNVDGTHDSSFNTDIGFNNSVHSIVIQNDQKIVVGGRFSSYDGNLGMGIARLSTDGTLDNSFDINPAFDNAVFGLAIQSDNKIIAGGYFTSYNGIGRNRIARLLGGCVDVSLSTHWSTITANNTNATYQWIDCSNNTPISNQTSQSFTATQDGDYAVIETSTLNSCIDTSECINITSASLEESFIDNGLRLYPNPNNGSFTIETSDPIKVEVFNSVGRKIIIKHLKSGKNHFNLENTENGIYYIYATDDLGNRSSQRVIIVE